ncbi:MAG TPA: nuclear transport factor 2 family protein [Streptomyces sp.]|uniref:nuclear transport factor 2 family protein n=1 Tax=Streptomyces sp. TaxID=1931 RepID=UPI002B6FB517|nr:nuclear transport factor 2 family protein [Streptomyces sp.]HWU11963.1 nuclear transport factor 2 family protein [Streptomyces sp.]
MSNSIAERIAAAYAAALADDRAEDLVALFGDRPRLQSPFSVWETPSTVRAVCLARTTAFHGVTVAQVLTDDDRAVVLWRATVRGELVEGCEVLTLSAGSVERVDVYLRPAPVLPTVYAAMSAAWPR